MTTDRKALGGNSTLAIGGVSSPLDSFLVQQSSVLRIKFSAEKPAHRQLAIPLAVIIRKHPSRKQEPILF